MEPLLTVNNLRVWLKSGDRSIRAVDRLSLTINPGETFALVGESGCGKSMSALAMMRLLPPNAQVFSDAEVIMQHQDLYNLSESEVRKIRGKDMAMIFQDPMAALNPVLTVGQQLSEAMGSSEKKTYKRRRALELLEQVRIPHPKALHDNYPHQLSGGMKQRVMIAMALARSPKLLIADEPTTALDVTTQAQILSLIQDLKKSFNTAVLLITHDLGVVAQMADTVGVMYAGHIVEMKPKKEFFNNPEHPYSQMLFDSLPEGTKHRTIIPAIPGSVPPLDHAFEGCRFCGRCSQEWDYCTRHVPKWSWRESGGVRCHRYHSEVQVPPLKKREIMRDEEKSYEVHEVENITPLMRADNLKVHYPIKKGLLKRTIGYVKAVDGVSLELFEDETLALVGESGCGKTTTGKAMVQLESPTGGDVSYMGKSMLGMSPRRLKIGRSHFQIVFQDPFSSMNPRMRVEEILLEGMRALKIGSNQAERLERIDNLLEQVGLSQALKSRYPHELSGGQRQRICIARALSVGPKIIVCDEPTSALDVSVQAQILNLLQKLQDEYGIAYLFITHDIGVVEHIADRVAVMYLGRVVETGESQEVLGNPKHPYTQLLLEAVPRVKGGKPIPTGIQTTEVPSPTHPPAGCHFHARCPNVMPVCLETYPKSYEVSKARFVACHLMEPA